MTRTLRIGTRGSALALTQASWVADRLAGSDVPAELVVIRTEGDDHAADTAWGEGAFVGRIVEALRDGSVDVAVHSAKDVPTDEHPDLVIAAYPTRDDPRDALVCRVRGSTLATLPEGSRIGTDSPRRRSFLHALRPDLRVHPLHGNVDTRLAKLDRGETDALVLAVAGLARLGRADRIDEILPADVVTAAPGQGSLAIQVRASDAEAIAAVARLDDRATRIAVVSERLLLNATGGGCRSPIGAMGRLDGHHLELIAGAERTWRPLPGAAIEVAPVVWVRGTDEVEAHRVLAERLAARIVALRARPRVLVTRAAAQAPSLVAALGRVGIDAVSVPAIEIDSGVAGGPLDTALAQASAGTWVVPGSSNGAATVMAAVDRVGLDRGSLRWAAVGPVSADVLHANGVPDVFVPSTATGLALAAELPIHAGDGVLLPRTDAADSSLPEALRARGAQVEEVLAYRTIEAPPASRPLLAAALDDGPVDALLLTSGSTARGVLALSDEAGRERLRRTPVIAIGAPTAAAARALGFTSVHIAPQPAAPALAVFTAAALGLGPTPAMTGGMP